MNTEVQAVYKRFRPIALLLAILSGAAILFGFFSSDHALKEQAFQSYLYGYVFWAGLTLGCFGFTLFHHTIRGAWGLAILRLLESGGGPVMLAIFGVLSIPLLISAADPNGLYHAWSGTGFLSAKEVARKGWYLNQG